MTDYRESQQPASEAWKTQPGWVLYDGECRLCTRWVHRFELPLKRRGFGLRPLQSAWARERLGLDSAELLREMRLVFPDGKIKGGADAIVELSRHFWWGSPVYWFCRLPTIMSLLRAVYRYVAMRRCNEGACAAPLAARRPFWWEWFPLIVLPGMALLTRTVLPAWGFMWLIAFAIFLGCKWITWRRANRQGLSSSVAKAIGYFLAWPGMDAHAFFKKAEHPRRESSVSTLRPLNSCWPAIVKIVLGAILIWLAARYAVHTDSLIIGWVGMLGIVLLLHFGLFDLLAWEWQRAGVEVKPVMRAPLRATSLGDFWGRRWNTAFNGLAFRLAFRPLARRLGVTGATMGVFLISGLVHEAVISLPAQGGYGLPTAYFILQGLGVLVERSERGSRLGLGRGLRGWLFVALFTAGPAFWLFHVVFIHNVILPMLHAIGAT